MSTQQSPALTSDVTYQCSSDLSERPVNSRYRDSCHITVMQQQLTKPNPNRVRVGLSEFLLQYRCLLHRLTLILYLTLTVSSNLLHVSTILIGMRIANK